MARLRGVEAHQEVDITTVLRDARPWWIQFSSWLHEPQNLSISVAVVTVIAVGVPMLAPLALVVIGLAWLTFQRHLPQMPLRVPKGIGAKDPTDLDPVTKRPVGGNGILYLGNNRTADGRQEECWITDSDARTHMMVLGTTGSGKSEFLMSLVFNALAWGSGFIYVDGKADNSLPFKIYSLCKRLGREDDFLLVNFMTGDQDAFTRKRDESRMSNTINVFSDGSANTWTQLVSSLMAEAGGDNALWKGLAVGMINAVLTGLAYKRWRVGLPVDAGVIRDHIELGKLIELTKEFSDDPDVPRDLVFKPLEAYLLNLPGFDWQKNLVQGEVVSEDTKKQHDFRSMQFLRQLTMLADTYGHIFKHRLAEVDVLDVVLNRRILVVMIPSLEKSEEESEGVGKLLISALKLMMALTLGSHVEGMYDDVVGSKPTNAPAPYPCVLDELGYYFTKGLAVMYAQARSLGFMMVGGGQDLPAMMKGKNKEEAESVIANSKFKISLAMEDPQQTGDLIIKTAGDAVVSETAGAQGYTGVLNNGYQDMLNATFKERKRVTLQELRDLDSGQGILLWRDRVVRFATYYIFKKGSAEITKRIPVKLNRLVKLFAPSEGDLSAVSEPISQTGLNNSARISDIFAGREKPTYVVDDTDFTVALRQAHVDFPRDRSMACKDREVALFAKTLEIWKARKANEAQAPKGKDAPPEPPPPEDESIAEQERRGSSGGGQQLVPRRQERDAAAGTVDVTEFVDEQPKNFVVATKADIEAQEVTAPVGAEGAEQGAEADGEGAGKLDWVDTAVAGGEIAMNGEVADLLARMDGMLQGGQEVDPAAAATRYADPIVDALSYDPVEPMAPDADVDEKVDRLHEMFKGF